MCFDTSDISCRLLLVLGLFQYLHLKADIPTDRLPQNLSRKVKETIFPESSCANLGQQQLTT